MIFMNTLDAIVIKAAVSTDADTAYVNGLTRGDMEDIIRKATLTEWFVNPIRGQPRYVDIFRLRNYSKSEWVSVVVNYLLNRIRSIPFEIIPRDPKKRESPSERLLTEIEETTDFFHHCTQDGKGFKQAVEPAFIRDVLELDAGVIVKYFTKNSYIGDPTKPKSLNPRGSRTLVELAPIDGGAFCKDIDAKLRLNAYWQHFYKSPGAMPIFFDPAEVCYLMRYPRSYSPYGWSPIQSADAVLNSLINSAAWNANFFSNQAVPKGMITIEGDDTAIRRFRAYWQNRIEGKWHTIPIVNGAAKFVPFSITAADMEWLSGQKWYQRMVCAAYQVHPSEVGVEDTSRQAGEAASVREGLQKRSSIIPLLILIEDAINADIMPELSNRLMFHYTPSDPESEKEDAELKNTQIELGLKTINQIRVANGEKPVPWGNVPPAILANVMRSFGRLGQMPPIEDIEKMDFSSIKPPPPPVIGNRPAAPNSNA